MISSLAFILLVVFALDIKAKLSPRWGYALIVVMKKHGSNTENISHAVLRLGTKLWWLRAPLTFFRQVRPPIFALVGTRKKSRTLVVRRTRIFFSQKTRKDFFISSVPWLKLQYSSVEYSTVQYSVLKVSVSVYVLLQIWDWRLSHICILSALFCCPHDFLSSSLSLFAVALSIFLIFTVSVLLSHPSLRSFFFLFFCFYPKTHSSSTRKKNWTALFFSFLVVHCLPFFFFSSLKLSTYFGLN